MTPELPGTSLADTAAAGLLGRARRSLRAARAATSFERFAEFVLRDESTGAPLLLAPCHRQWAHLLQHHDRLQILAHVESGKSQLLTIGWTLYQLGRNPNLRVCIISNTAAQGEKLLRSIARMIERSAPLREVFPRLRQSTPWSVNAITVERDAVSKDASVFACGIHGALLGSRVDLLLVDDPVDFEGARTDDGRASAVDWLTSTAFSRLTSHGRVVVVGTPWHREDLHGRLEQLGWGTYRFPVERDDGSPSWPERWSVERIARKRLELGPAQSARQLDVMCAGDGSSVFDPAWLQQALNRGRENSLLSRLSPNERGEPHWVSQRRTWPARILVGLDPSVGNTSKSDLSAIAVIYLREDRGRELVEVQSGHWNAPEILARIQSVNARFAPSAIVVESNAAQAYLVHFMSNLPVQAFTTGRDKQSLEWLAQRLAAEFAAGQWVIPSVNGTPATSELRALVRDLMSYSPADHCPDRVSALLMATTAVASSLQRVETFKAPISLAR